MNKKIKSIISMSLLTSSLVLGPAVKTYAWDSRQSPDTMDTHKTISVQALKIIENDNKDEKHIQDNLQILYNNLREFKRGAVAPDFGALGTDRDYLLYQDHFFDPNTGKNFTSYSPYPFSAIPDTAESQSRNYVGQAVARWKDGEYAEATYLLGKATHYFADLNEPHHASNITGGAGTAHTKFETFAEEVKDNYKLETLGDSIIKDECHGLSHKSLADFITTQSYKYAKKANILSEKTTLSNSWDDWHFAVKESLENSQRGVATIIYRFLQEVNNSSIVDTSAPIGKFHVVINTADEKNAGTDDYVYFGIQLKSGKEVEFKCDLPGDDFVRNYTTAYEFEITDADFKFSDISKVWVRKQTYAGDDWKLKNVELYIQGQRVLNESINNWLHGNTTYDLSLKN